MKIFNKYWIGLLAGVSLSQMATGQTRIYVNEYLNIGVGGRGLAMSGAQVASTGDVFSSYWNPAGLVFMNESIQLGGMHAEYFGGISKYDYLGFGIKNKDESRAIGFSFIRFGTDDIPYTLDYVRPDGSFDESKLKGFSAGDYAGLITISQKLNKLSNEDWTTSIGGNAKILYRNVGKMANAWGVGLDVGLQARKDRLNLGVTIKDVTSTYTSWSFNLTEEEKEIFGNTGNEIPIKSYEVMMPRLNFGASYQLVRKEDWSVLGEIGLDMTTDGKRRTIMSTDVVSFDPKLGFEVAYKDNVYLRAGVNNFYYVYNNDDITHEKKYLMYQPSVGVGIKLLNINVDYSFTSLQVQDNPLMSHIVSLRVDLNRMDKKDKKSTTPIKDAQDKTQEQNTSK